MLAFTFRFATRPGVCLRVRHLLVIEAFVLGWPAPVLLALALSGIGESLLHGKGVIHVVALICALVQGLLSGADFQGAVPDAVPKINEQTCGRGKHTQISSRFRTPGTTGEMTGLGWCTF